MTIQLGKQTLARKGSNSTLQGGGNYLREDAAVFHLASVVVSADGKSHAFVGFFQGGSEYPTKLWLLEVYPVAGKMFIMASVAFGFIHGPYQLFACMYPRFHTGPKPGIIPSAEVDTV